jgi:hypothetical protein
MKILHIILAALLLSLTVSATQVIVINETTEKVYALDTILLSGDLESNVLDLTGSGEIIQGTGVKVYLFGPASEVLVKELKINGQATTTSFDKEGYFFVADKGPLVLEGKLAIRTIGQVNLYVPGPVNELRFALRNGYAIGGDRYGAYKETVILQRSEAVSMIVDGSFRFSYAERNEFLYVINFRAYGSTLGNYVLNLPNLETVTGVTGAVKWEQRGSSLILDLKSSQATVTVQGLFDSQNLHVPLKEERHHVLIESDPEKKISISTSAQEVDLSESTIPPTYANARAFLASRQEEFAVTVKKLDVLPSLAASVRSSTNQVAITEKGSVLSETTYSYANTGVDYVDFEAEGTPLYASTQGGAVKLTSDKKLLLSFPKTSYGTLDLVTFTTRSPLGPFSMVDVPIAKSDLPITTASTSIYLPANYVVLWTEGAQGGSEIPGIEGMILFVLIMGAIAAAVKKNMKFIVGYMLLAAGLYYFNAGLFLLLIAVSLILVARRFMPKDAKIKWLIAGAVVMVAVVMLLFVPLIIWQLGVFGGAGGSVTRMDGDYAVVDKSAAAPSFNGMETVGEGSGAITVPQRPGVLPVKLELPQLGKTITVTNHLVTKENQISLKVWLLADYFKYLLYLIAAVGGFMAYKEYGKAAA